MVAPMLLISPGPFVLPGPSGPFRTHGPFGPSRLPEPFEPSRPPRTPDPLDFLDLLDIYSICIPCCSYYNERRIKIAFVLFLNRSISILPSKLLLRYIRLSYMFCFVILSWGLEATPSATPFFKTAYKISHLPRL